MDKLSSDLKGLRVEDAEARLKYGLNEIPKVNKTILKIFRLFLGTYPLDD